MFTRGSYAVQCWPESGSADDLGEGEGCAAVYLGFDGTELHGRGGFVADGKVSCDGCRGFELAKEGESAGRHGGWGCVQVVTDRLVIWSHESPAVRGGSGWFFP